MTYNAHRALLVSNPAGMLATDLLTTGTNALIEDNDILICHQDPNVFKAHGKVKVQPPAFVESVLKI